MSFQEPQTFVDGSGNLGVQVGGVGIAKVVGLINGSTHVLGIGREPLRQSS